MIRVSKLDISKLDFHKGSPDREQQPISEEDQEDFDEIEAEPV